jgi:hypothetical protein
VRRKTAGDIDLVSEGADPLREFNVMPIPRLTFDVNFAEFVSEVARYPNYSKIRLISTFAKLAQPDI